MILNNVGIMSNSCCRIQVFMWCYFLCLMECVFGVQGIIFVLVYLLDIGNVKIKVWQFFGVFIDVVIGQLIGVQVLCWNDEQVVVYDVIYCMYVSGYFIIGVCGVDDFDNCIDCWIGIVGMVEYIIQFFGIEFLDQIVIFQFIYMVEVIVYVKVEVVGLFGVLCRIYMVLRCVYIKMLKVVYIRQDDVVECWVVFQDFKVKCLIIFD